MITLVSSTNRPGSFTRRLVHIYQSILEEMDEEVQVLDLINLPEKLMVTDLYGKRSSEFLSFQEMVLQSDRFIFFIPEYNGSFPGVLKLFIDALVYPDSFYGKKAALVGLSSGTYGNIRGVDHFTGIAHYIGLKVLPLKIHIPFIKKEINSEGNMADGPSLKFIHQQIHDFIAF